MLPSRRFKYRKERETLQIFSNYCSIFSGNYAYLLFCISTKWSLLPPYSPKIKVSILPEQNPKDDKGNSVFTSILEKHDWRPLFDPWDYMMENERIDIDKLSSDFHMSIVPYAYTSRNTNKQRNILLVSQRLLQDTWKSISSKSRSRRACLHKARMTHLNKCIRRSSFAGVPWWLKALPSPLWFLIMFKIVTIISKLCICPDLEQYFVVAGNAFSGGMYYISKCLTEHCCLISGVIGLIWILKYKWLSNPCRSIDTIFNRSHENPPQLWRFQPQGKKRDYD